MRGWPRRSVRAGWHPHCSLPTAAQASHDVARSDAGSSTGPRRSVIYLDGSVALAHALFWDDFVRQFRGVARPAKRKLEAINAAVRLDDLKVPPANRPQLGDLRAPPG